MSITSKWYEIGDLEYEVSALWASCGRPPSGWDAGYPSEIEIAPFVRVHGLGSPQDFDVTTFDTFLASYMVANGILLKERDKTILRIEDDLLIDYIHDMDARDDERHGR